MKCSVLLGVCIYRYAMGRVSVSVCVTLRIMGCQWRKMHYSSEKESKQLKLLLLHLFQLTKWRARLLSGPEGWALLEEKHWSVTTRTTRSQNERRYNNVVTAGTDAIPRDRKIDRRKVGLNQGSDQETWSTVSDLGSLLTESQAEKE